METNSNTNPKKGLYPMQLNAFLNQTVNSILDPDRWGIFSITSYSILNTTGGTFKTWVIETTFHTQVKLLEYSLNYPLYWDEPSNNSRMLSLPNWIPIKTSFGITWTKS